MVIVAASGNEGKAGVRFPARLPETIASVLAWRHLLSKSNLRMYWLSKKQIYRLSRRIVF